MSFFVRNIGKSDGIFCELEQKLKKAKKHPSEKKLYVEKKYFFVILLNMYYEKLENLAVNSHCYFIRTIKNIEKRNRHGNN